jgi:hypothetical protein
MKNISINKAFLSLAVAELQCEHRLGRKGEETRRSSGRGGHEHLRDHTHTPNGYQTSCGGKKEWEAKDLHRLRDLNRATSKDEYLLPIANLLVDTTAGHKIISFIDGNVVYNQIFMAKEDILKTTFRCLGAIDLYERVVFSFGLKNTGATYQRTMNYMFYNLIEQFVKYIFMMPS